MAGDGAKTYVCVGQFAGPHGLKGAIRLKSFTESPEAIKGFSCFYLDGEKPLKILFSNPAKGGFLVTIPGVSNPEDAAPFKGQKVFVERGQLKDLDEDEFYLTDLEGLLVLGLEGKELGRAEKVYDFGAGPVLEIALREAVKDYGKTLMLPFQNDAITGIDLAAGTINIDLAGWLEEGEGS